MENLVYPVSILITILIFTFLLYLDFIIKRSSNTKNLFKWEIVNTTGFCVIESKSFLCAAVSIYLIGSGIYGLRPLGKTDPLHRMTWFFEESPNLWFVEVFGQNFNDSLTYILDNDIDSLIDTLRSIWIPEGKKTSLHSMQAFAFALADRLENTIS
jgi:hypothetical protein